MANIFQNYLQPVRSVADFGADIDRRDLLSMQLEGQQRQNAISGMDMQGKIGEMRESRRQQQEMRGLTYTDPAQWVRDLRGKGLHGAAGSFEKERADIEAKAAAANENKGKALASFIAAQGQLAGQVVATPTREAAAAAVMNSKRFAQHLSIPFDASADEAAIVKLQSPDDIKRYFAGQAMKASELLAKIQSMGGFMGAIDPLTNRVTNIGEITQSADNAGTTAASIENNKRTVAATLRGQNMVDARTRESTAAAMSKPFEVTGPNGPILVQQTKGGKIIPVDGYTPKTAPDKPLAPSVVKNITEARDNALTIANLSGSFKPEFAGKGVLGLGADMQMTASGNVGADTDAVEWWKNYRKQAELIERHALFGAALTPTEQASWRSADIGPGMDAKVVARNLATREKFTKQVLDAARQDSIDAGHSETRVNAIAGRKPSDAGGQKASGAVQTATNPKTGEKLQLVNGQWVPAK